MQKTLVAIPSCGSGGLGAEISEHFGHCDIFTVVEIESGNVTKVEAVPGISNQQGGCMDPVNLLAIRGVNILIAEGVGMRPLAGLNQLGIDVYNSGDALQVGQAIQAFLNGNMKKFSSDSSCASHDDGCCKG